MWLHAIKFHKTLQACSLLETMEADALSPNDFKDESVEEHIMPEQAVKEQLWSCSGYWWLRRIHGFLRIHSPAKRGIVVVLGTVPLSGSFLAWRCRCLHGRCGETCSFSIDDKFCLTVAVAVNNCFSCLCSCNAWIISSFSLFKIGNIYLSSNSKWACKWCSQNQRSGRSTALKAYYSSVSCFLTC